MTSELMTATDKKPEGRQIAVIFLGSSTPIHSFIHLTAVFYHLHLLLGLSSPKSVYSKVCSPFSGISNTNDLNPYVPHHLQPATPPPCAFYHTERQWRRHAGQGVRPPAHKHLYWRKRRLLWERRWLWRWLRWLRRRRVWRVRAQCVCSHVWWVW